jgi:hypothetical protein
MSAFIFWSLNRLNFAHAISPYGLTTFTSLYRPFPTMGRCRHAGFKLRVTHAHAREHFASRLRTVSLCQSGVKMANDLILVGITAPFGPVSRPPESQLGDSGRPI